MRTNVQCGRITYEPTYNYNIKVLVGSDQERLEYVQNNWTHNTIYRTDFNDPGPSQIDKNQYWDYIIEGEGISARVLFDHERLKYHENYSTTYDLSYNHLSRLKEGQQLRTYRPIMKKYHPEQDYAQNYGNITNWGLRPVKKDVWERDQVVDTKSYTTTNLETYLPPNMEDYSFKRKAIPREVSSNLCKTNEYVNWHLRDQLISIVPDVQLSVKPRNYPHFYYCH